MPDPEIRFSLITFGCSPVTNQPLTPYINSLMAVQAKPGVALAIINEHDPIPRADSSYVKSVTKLYNLYGGLALDMSRSSNGPWRFQAQDLHIVGDLIVLRDKSLEEQKDIHA